MTKFLASVTLFFALLFTPTAEAQPLKIITLTDMNTVVFNGTFTSSFVSSKLNELMKLATTLRPGEPIYLVMDSPGGSVTAGATFIDAVRTISLRNPVHTITIFAASMAYQTVQALGIRYAIPSGILMSHRMQASGLAGQIPGELNSIVNFYAELGDAMDKTASTRVGISQKDYAELIRDEFWATANKAKSMNHIDEVILAVCDQTLLGLTNKDISVGNGFFSLNVRAKVSHCPLLRAPLEIENSYEFNEEGNRLIELFFSDKGLFIKQLEKRDL